MLKIILSANTDWYLYNFRLPFARYLRKNGWQVLFLTPPGQFTGAFEKEGFPWIQWDLGRKTLNPLQEWRAYRSVLAVYRSEKPDLVHHHTIKPGIYGSIAARKAGVPGIVNSITGRGYVFLGKDILARMLRPLAIGLYRYAFRGDNLRAIFENRTDLDYFVRTGLLAPEQGALIESVGVDPDTFQPSPEPEGKPVVLMAARMLWDKGAGVLVEAARLLGAPEKVRVVLAGDPDPGNPGSIPPAQLRAWNEEGTIEWWGFQDDMAAALQKCHIFALPTMYGEGIPVSLMEASAAGKPVVSTRIPGPADFVVEGETGLLVPPDDAGALARALEQLAGNPGLRGRMGRAGRQRVLERFTNDRVHNQTFKLFQDLLARERLD